MGQFEGGNLYLTPLNLYCTDLTHQNTGQSFILCEAIRLVKDTIAQIKCLEKEYSALSSESHYVRPVTCMCIIPIAPFSCVWQYWQSAVSAEKGFSSLLFYISILFKHATGSLPPSLAEVHPFWEETCHSI